MPVRLLGAIWICAFLVSVDYTALNVALPSLAADFALGTSEVSWVALSYLLSQTALMPVSGHVIERLGHRRALTAGIALFAATSLASVVVPSLWMLVALRGIQGIGASVMFVVGPYIVQTVFPQESRDRG